MSQAVIVRNGKREGAVMFSRQNLATSLGVGSERKEFRMTLKFLVND